MLSNSVFWWLLRTTESVPEQLFNATKHHEEARNLAEPVLFAKWDAFIREDLDTISPEQYSERFANLQLNMERVKVLNEQNADSDVVFDVSPLDQYSDAEYEQMLNFRKPLALTSQVTIEPESTAESYVDWQKRGAVTHVKNQGRCGGSGWAFAGVALLESRWVMDGNPLTAFSEQQIIDCNFKSFGCDGGAASIVINDLDMFHHIESEDEYPYIARREWCRANPRTLSQFHLKVRTVRTFDYETLMYAVARYGVLSIAVDASSPKWRYYKRGLLTAQDCEFQSRGSLNHAVALVGFKRSFFRRSLGEPIIIWGPIFRIKNSWGEHWGSRGYISIMGFQNTCLFTNAVVVGVPASASVQATSTANTLQTTRSNTTDAVTSASAEDHA